MIKRISILTALSIALLSFVAPASNAASVRHVTVKAQGSVKVVPDAVRINATATSVAANSRDALSQTSAAAAAIRAALVAAKVASRDIATQSITVAPEYRYTNEGGATLTGYRGTQSFSITIRAAATAGAVVDAIVAAGGDSVQINGVNPFVLDSSKSSEAARSVAVKNAKARALSYAKLLGVKLGKVQYLIEESAPSAIAPIFATTKAESDATIVDLGEQDVTVSITVRWSLL
jgi:uncharacterized protein